jgi:hypothetical protein
VSALHVDHGLRPGSREDATACAALCERLGVELVVHRAGAPPERGNLHAWARASAIAPGGGVAAGRRAAGHGAHRDRPGRDDPLPAGRLARALGAVGMRDEAGALVRPLLRRRHARGDRGLVHGPRAGPGARTVQRRRSLRAHARAEGSSRRCARCTPGRGQRPAHGRAPARGGGGPRRRRGQAAAGRDEIAVADSPRCPRRWPASWSAGWRRRRPAGSARGPPPAWTTCSALGAGELGPRRRRRRPRGRARRRPAFHDDPASARSGRA